MKKKKNIFTKIASFFMIFCMAFLTAGWSECGDPAGYEEGQESEEGSSLVSLYGTKVLYRPDHYDYNKNSGGSDDSPNIYYGVYAWQIINALYEIYGIPNTASDRALDKFNHEMFVSENLPYLYDSIRYKVDTFGIVTTDKDGNPLITENDGVITDNSYVILGADTTANWNWSFEADLDNALSYIYSNIMSYNQHNAFTLTNNLSHIFNIYGDKDYALENLTAHYKSNDSTLKTDYPQIYRGPSQPKPDEEHPNIYDEYSQFTKAMEYVIYSYALDLEPAQLTVTKFESEPYYNITLPGYNSIEEALDDRIALFERIGSYVGLVDRQVTKITNWILENVIGTRAMASDTFTYYDNVSEIDDGHGGITYSLGTPNAEKTHDLGRNYQDTVEALVKGVCSEATIGQDSESDDGTVHIDERYLASEIAEYNGGAFVIRGDENFALNPDNPRAPYIRPMEYQSVTLMFKKDMYITDLMVALKYDAGLDGTSMEEGFGESYIDIIMDLNYYNHETNTLKTLSSDVVRVFDGPYLINFVGDYSRKYYDDDVPEGHHSGFWFSNIGEAFDSEFGSAILVKAFNPDVGNGVMKTDVGRSGYDGSVVLSQEPKALNGLTNLRKYYNLLESEINEEGVAQNHSYISGRLNSDMFAGSDGCDYLEITYKVIKKNGDHDTNYKFYTGLQLVWGQDKESVDRENN